MSLLTHSYSSSRRNRRIRFFAGACIGLLVIITVIQVRAPHVFSGFLSAVAVPFWRTEFAIESGSLKSPQELLKENEGLKRDLDAAKLDMQTMGATEQENQELKALLGRSSAFDLVSATDPSLRSGPSASATSSPASAQSSGSPSVVSKSSKKPALQPSLKPILAAVLMRPALAPYDELIIDAGSDLGFSQGDKVYASGGVLIGTVSDVLDHTSKVALYSSPGQTHDVLIGPGNAPATAIGRGGGQYSAELPRNVSIAKDDYVIAPSLNDKPFGIVSAVLSDPARAFETVLFAPPINIYQLRWVLVEVKDKK